LPAPLLDFCSLQHLQDPEVHSPRAFQHPLRSACRVWLPSWRLTPSEPAPALFRADSALGIAPFGAFPSQKVSARVSATDEPACRFSRRFLRHLRAEPFRRAAASGLSPFRESLAAKHVFSTPTAGGSLGFRPFQGFPARTLARFLALSSHTLSSGDSRRRLPDRRPRVSIDSRFASTPSRRASRRFWPKQPS